jgi:hypothetical protein
MELPYDVIRSVIHRSDLREIFAFCTTSKSWANVCSNKRFWLDVLERGDYKYVDLLREAMASNNKQLLHLLLDYEYFGYKNDDISDPHLKEEIARYREDDDVDGLINFLKEKYPPANTSVSELTNDILLATVEDPLEYDIFLRILEEYGITKSGRDPYRNIVDRGIWSNALYFGYMPLIMDMNMHMSRLRDYALSALLSYNPQTIYYMLDKLGLRELNQITPDLIEKITEFPPKNWNLSFSYPPLRLLFIYNHPNMAYYVISDAIDIISTTELSEYLDNLPMSREKAISLRRNITQPEKRAIIDNWLANNPY